MCGIAGIWWSDGKRQDEAEAMASAMAAGLHHRGPDARGVWADGAAGIALGHARLSILDLSPAGAQPMESVSGRYVIVFNGEIYNHRDLRRELETAGSAPNWQGHSDTETVLALIDAEGLDRAIVRCIGMFALAVWDRSTRTLTLARDRMGEKPLYYGCPAGALIFASELKALMPATGSALELAPEAISAYLRFSYVPDPLSIYQGIGKLPPGHVVRFRHPSQSSEAVPYWRFEDAMRSGRAIRSPVSYGDIRRDTEATLRNVVQSQMMSDVPLGCFLSGGIDSSLIAALMQSSSSRQIRTFSIGFENTRFSEATAARCTAEHLGTEHTEFVITEAEALSIIGELPSIYDEPFADASQIPTILLSRLTRQHVTVALSGDGGDEIFGGYNRYTFGPALWQVASLIASPGRRLTAWGTSTLKSVAAADVTVLHNISARLGLPVTTIDRLAKFGEAVGRSKDFAGLYSELVSTFSDAGKVLRRDFPAHHAPTWSRFDDEVLSRQEWMMAQDAATYLPGDILVKVDRAAMSASLETRAPFLDLRTIEMSCRLPIEAKIKGRVGKRILRDILVSHVPRSYWDRPKQGFAVPMDQWLRGQLKEWAGDLLSSNSITSTGIFDRHQVEDLWNDHIAGRDNKGAQLWTILMMQSWLCNRSALATAEAAA